MDNNKKAPENEGENKLPNWFEHLGDVAEKSDAIVSFLSGLTAEKAFNILDSAKRKIMKKATL